MQSKTTGITILALLPAALFTLASCSTTSQPPPPAGAATLMYVEGVPGGVLLQTFKTTATVAAIDHAKRSAVLRAADGEEFAVTMGRQIVDLDQVRVGDKVAATVTQKVLVHLGDEEASRGRSAAALTTPKQQVIELVAKIIAIDLEKHTATVQFNNGNTETLSVRDDVDLSHHKLGEKVVFRVTEMIAVSVEKQQ